MATCWDLEVTQTSSPRWLMIQTSYKTTLCKLSQPHIHRHTRAFWGVSCLHVCIWLQWAMLIIACIARWDSEAIQTHSSEWLLTQTSRNTILCKWSQTCMHNHSLRFLTCTPIHIATCVHTYNCIYICIYIYIEQYDIYMWIYYIYILYIHIFMLHMCTYVCSKHQTIATHR